MEILRDRQINIKLSTDGKLSMTGDTFTVGELLQIGDHIKNGALNQNLTFPPIAGIPDVKNPPAEPTTGSGGPAGGKK
jgi:hypothetical protein